MRKTLKKGMVEFRDWIVRLFRQPIFLFVTLWGHSAIFLSAVVFHAVEESANPKAPSLFQSYYWALSTATTVGTTDLAPVTLVGKVVAILLMIFGSLFLWSYTALFAAAFMSPAVSRVGREVEEVEREVRVDRETLFRLVRELEEWNKEKGKK